MLRVCLAIYLSFVTLLQQRKTLNTFSLTTRPHHVYEGKCSVIFLVLQAQQSCD